jgi:hypothetical protein
VRIGFERKKEEPNGCAREYLLSYMGNKVVKEPLNVIIFYAN